MDPILRAEKIPTETLATHDETVILQYALWDSLFLSEKPYQIISDFGRHSEDLRNTNLAYEPGKLETIYDIRGRESDFALDEHGFAVCNHQSALQSFKDSALIEGTYLPEMEELLKQQVEDVDEIFFFDWRIRRNEPFSKTGTVNLDLDDLSQYLQPVKTAHIDQTPRAVLRRVQFHMSDKVDKLLKGRVRAINIWRPTNFPIEDSPLALCDGSTVEENDLLATDHVRRDYIGETYNLMYKPKYKWHYLHRQTRDEVFIFKMYDSLSNVKSKWCPHVSFEHSHIREGAPPRQSIEVRALVFSYPEEE